MGYVVLLRYDCMPFSELTSRLAESRTAVFGAERERELEPECFALLVCHFLLRA